MICLIFLVGSIKLMTSSTQLLTPAEKMTGSHYSLRQARKLSRFFRLQMLSRHSQSQNQRWKSSLRLGAIRYPSSSGVKVKASTSSSYNTTVILDGSLGGGSSLALCLLAQRMGSTKQRLFLGFYILGGLYWGGFLLKLKRALPTWETNPFLIITQFINIQQNYSSQINQPNIFITVGAMLYGGQGRMI